VVKKRKQILVQRLSHPGADYLRLAGELDQSFTDAVGKVTRATVLDLGGVTSITSQGVECWCDFVKSVPQSRPSDVALYLLNVPACIATQIEFVPNFAGPSEIVTVSVQGKCANCDHEQHLVADMVAYATGSQLMERCPKCGAALVPVDVDLSQLSRWRAQKLLPAVADLMAQLGVYRLSARAVAPFEIQKLVVENANLVRMSGTLDERKKVQRLVDGLEGTLLLEVSQLDVTLRGMSRFSELVTHAAKLCSPIVIVDLPYGVLEQTIDALAMLKQLSVHSILAPCYCSACDEIRQLPLFTGQLLDDEPKGACPRCGREAAMVGGVLPLDRLRPLLRPTPSSLVQVIGRFHELFSAAAVEARLATAPAEPSDKVPERIGPYRIVRAIARGGMADVFLAARDDFSKPVALKLLRREVLAQARMSLDMFLREARLNALLNHPNIVQVFDVNEAEGNLYIVMEYLEGNPLWRIFKHHGSPWPVPIAIRIAEQVLSALSHAHTAKNSDGQPLNLVHRDVSPSNILMGPDGNVKLIDFGIAIVGRKAEVFAGNPAWMSPEQFSSATLDGRSDLFSVATVLHELLTGRGLFEGSTVNEIAQKVFRMSIPQIHGISPALQRVMDRAHQRDPKMRYQTASEFLDALRSVQNAKDQASENDVRAFVHAVMTGEGLATRPTPKAMRKSEVDALASLPPSHMNTLPQITPPQPSQPSLPVPEKPAPEKAEKAAPEKAEKAAPEKAEKAAPEKAEKAAPDKATPAIAEADEGAVEERGSPRKTLKDAQPPKMPLNDFEASLPPEVTRELTGAGLERRRSPSGLQLLMFVVLVALAVAGLVMLRL
jgi:serine/threonine protein kinase